MVEAQRHSVDIPISRTLVALKRVRSLRDPSTNSLGKYATIIEHLAWETNSCNGATLELQPSGKHHLAQCKQQLKEEEEDVGSNSESNHSLRATNHKTTISRKQSNVKIRGLDPSRNKLIHKARRDRHRPRKSVDSTWVQHSRKQAEEEAHSFREAAAELADKINSREAKKSHHDNLRKPSAAASRVGSPSISVSEAGSRKSHLGPQNKLNDVVDSNFSGCGISYCWSGTPKYKGRNIYSDDEQEQPLISAEGTATSFLGVDPCPESPRNLSQKYRPKSFGELVGLDVVTHSLLYAITKGKIAPLYLFHGPHGNGKTTTARIFAAALNCLSLDEHRPCGCCRECVLLFSGKSKDVKELDAAQINQKDKVKALLKNASLVPFSSRFKVIIIDECQSLQEETWVSILKSIDDFPPRAIYVMVTSDLDALPRNSVSRCQRYHFPKIKDDDIICKMQKMCAEEQLDFDMDALHFIAAKSSGSLRDAETMLDQLALLGKRITVSLVYELIGVISDDELLDLLDIAFSSDTANTVRKSRELMRSRVDPLQLISQLANVIMDILAGRSGFSEVGKNFIRKYSSEARVQKLRNALKVLSETEKQLRTSKNQATWLTVALLQFSSEETLPLVEGNGSHTFSTMGYLRDSTLSATSPRVRQDNTICYACNHHMSKCSYKHCNRKKLESIWKKAIQKCQSSSFRSFLQQEGYLSSICILEGMAIAEVEFCHQDHVARAAKSGEMIASALQHVLGCNVEIRMKLVPRLTKKDSKLKKSFSFLSCSGRKQGSSDAMADEYENGTPTRRETSFRTYIPHCDRQLSPFVSNFGDKPMEDYYDVDEVMVRKTEEESHAAESIRTDGPITDDFQKEFKSQSKFSDNIDQGQNICMEEPEVHPSCFPKTLKLQRKLFSSNTAHTICLRIQPQNKFELSIPKKGLSESYFSMQDSYALSSSMNSQVTFSSREEIAPSRVRSRLLCWRSPKSQDIDLTEP